MHPILAIALQLPNPNDRTVVGKTCNEKKTQIYKMRLATKLEV